VVGYEKETTQVFYAADTVRGVKGVNDVVCEGGEFSWCEGRFPVGS
jgi:hypothetical protein